MMELITTIIKDQGPMYGFLAFGCVVFWYAMPWLAKTGDKLVDAYIARHGK